MKLHDLKPALGSRKKRKRVGRGMASGKGKTSGRGMKGQNARSGGGKGPYFEGGQLPLVRRLPFRRGFTNINKIEYISINLGRLAEFFDETVEMITPELLVERGVVKRADKKVPPIVILGDGEFSGSVTIKAHRFSKSAKEKIEAAGGVAEIIPLSE